MLKAIAPDRRKEALLKLDEISGCEGKKANLSLVKKKKGRGGHGNGVGGTSRAGPQVLEPRNEKKTIETIGWKQIT